MATATGMTAARILQLIGPLLADASIDTDGTITFTRENGTTFNLETYNETQLTDLINELLTNTIIDAHYDGSNLVLDRHSGAMHDLGLIPGGTVPDLTIVGAEIDVDHHLIFTRYDESTLDLGDITTLVEGKGQVTPFSLGDPDIAEGMVEQRFRQIYPVNILGLSCITGFGYPPVGDDILLDLVQGDGPPATLWDTHPENRCVITDGTEVSVGPEAVPDITLIPANTSVRIQVLSVGTTDPGSYVIAHLRWQWAAS